MFDVIHGVMVFRPTGDYLLSSLMWFLAHYEESLNNVDPDLPINRMFSEKFETNEFLVLTTLFGLNHGIDIPDHFMDFDLTLNQFIRKVHSLPRQSGTEQFTHITGLQLFLQETVGPDQDRLAILNEDICGAANSLK